MTKEYFECGCQADEHRLVFEHNYEEIGDGFYENNLMVSTFLNQYNNVFKRIWVAIRYVCGHKSKYGYGHFDCTIIEEIDIPQLRDLCQKVLDKRDETILLPKRKICNTCDGKGHISNEKL